MRGFWHSAGVSFWRFFRLLLYAAVTAIALFAAVSGSLSPLISWLDERPWEPGFLLGRLLSIAALIVVGVWILLALDFARVRTAVDESRRTLRNWLWSLIFVWRHPVLTFGLMGSAALLFVIMAGIYTAIASGLRPSTWAVIVLIVIFQQILMCFRSSLRVGLVAAELACYRQLFPPAAVPEASAEPVFIELPPVAEPPTSPPAPGQVPPEAPDPL